MKLSCRDTSKAYSRGDPDDIGWEDEQTDPAPDWMADEHFACGDKD